LKHHLLISNTDLQPTTDHYSPLLLVIATQIYNQQQTTTHLCFSSSQRRFNTLLHLWTTQSALHAELYHTSSCYCVSDSLEHLLPIAKFAL